MSHLFISYSHKDREILNTVLAYLKEQGFTDNQIWYDNIEGGDNWRDEISSALDEAFAIAVIVTKNAVDSHYCTYEWAYALGQGIPILPLLFDEIPAKDVHAPLASKQFIDCTTEIPTTLKDKIKEHESIPPQVKIINEIVQKTIDLTHRRYFILTKIGGKLYEGIYQYTWTEFYKEANKALDILNKLMLDKSFAFSGRQYRYCWRIIQFLEIFSDLRYETEDFNHRIDMEDSYFMKTMSPRFETEWQPAYKYFGGYEYEWWERSSYRYFSLDLRHESSRLSVFGEIIRAFPDINVREIEELVDSLKRSQEHENNPDNE